MPEMQGMARPPGTRKREERLFVGLIVADVHSPWAIWVDCDADLGRTRLAAIEARLLVERLVELLHDRPHGAHRRQHGIEPLAHGIDPACRRARQRRRTRCLEDIERARRSVPELLEDSALGVVWTNRLRNPLDGPIRQPGGLPAAEVGLDASAAG